MLALCGGIKGGVIYGGVSKAVPTRAESAKVVSARSVGHGKPRAYRRKVAWLLAGMTYPSGWRYPPRGWRSAPPYPPDVTHLADVEMIRKVGGLESRNGQILLAVLAKLVRLDSAHDVAE